MASVIEYYNEFAFFNDVFNFRNLATSQFLKGQYVGIEDGEYLQYSMFILQYFIDYVWLYAP